MREENCKSRGNNEFGDDSISMLQQFLNLPKDVFMYLFSKLEVCSIIRCRSICKHWLRLLSDPEFVKLHLNHSKTTPKLLIQSNLGLSNYIQLESYDYSRCNNTPRFSHVNLPLVGEVVPYSANILGSCNGLLCMLYYYLHNSRRNEHKLVVWNPSTRDYKILPDPIKNGYYQHFDPYLLVGFGYDSSCEDYKLVRADSNCPSYEVEIYSLKTNLWKVIKIDSPHTFKACRYTPEGIFANGSFLYWMVDVVMGKGERGIVGYDLKKEKFTEAQCLPVDINISAPSYAKLLKVMGGDKLGLCCYYINNMGLWMMNKGGDKEEWSKLWSISYGDSRRQISLKYMFNGPICDFENGSVLFYDREVESATDQRLVLIVVDPKLNKIVGTIPVSGISNPCSFTSVETTLVSPNTFGCLSTAFE